MSQLKYKYLNDIFKHNVKNEIQTGFNLDIQKSISQEQHIGTGLALNERFW